MFTVKDIVKIMFHHLLNRSENDHLRVILKKSCEMAKENAFHFQPLNELMIDLIDALKLSYKLT